ncbi:hypothetical protein [Tropicimonas sp. IMCC34011]|uniref:hypothetical protein n=1 Tax=Tropicimonas sp. IMCC34011 TaxID=2248759 RepID=UPI000E2725F8|nr:hypothetical protein [Tropicimonas sp. IMCC34011]
MFKVQVKRTRHRRIPKAPTGPSRVKVGFPAGTAPGDIMDIAIWNHFGTRTIPERPFLDNAMRDNRDKYRDAMRRSARKILRGETSMSTVMQLLGNRAAADISNEIEELSTPANAPSTIRQKGSENPLVDSGRMRNSVTFKVDR